MNTSGRLRFDAVVAGYIGVDMAPGFSASVAGTPLTELLRPGTLVEVGQLSISLGGVVANTGLAMKKFGKRVALMGMTGSDVLGDIVAGRLRAEGIRSLIKRTSRAGTAYGIVIAPPGTDRIFLEDPGCNGMFSSRDIEYETVSRSRVFHFGYPTLMKTLYADNGAELKRMFSSVKKHGSATSLDMTLPDPSSTAGKADWQKILAATLPHVDIFVPSIEEILFMMEPKEYKRLLSKSQGGDIIDSVPLDLYRLLGDRLIDLGVKVLMIKAGHRGAYLRTGAVTRLNATTALNLPVESWDHREEWAKPFPVLASRMKNACGAGDCAVAAFLTAILDGMSLEMAGRCAMRAGRDNLYGVDAVSGLCDWRQMTR